MSYIALALKFIMWVAGLFGIGSKDERDKEREAGEKLGREETENRNAQEDIHELQTAIDAGAANPVDHKRLSDGTDPAAKQYVQGPD